MQLRILISHCFIILVCLLQIYCYGTRRIKTNPDSIVIIHKDAAIGHGEAKLDGFGSLRVSFRLEGYKVGTHQYLKPGEYEFDLSDEVARLEKLKALCGELQRVDPPITLERIDFQMGIGAFLATMRIKNRSNKSITKIQMQGALVDPFTNQDHVCEGGGDPRFSAMIYGPFKPDYTFQGSFRPICITASNPSLAFRAILVHYDDKSVAILPMDDLVVFHKGEEISKSCDTLESMKKQ